MVCYSLFQWTTFRQLSYWSWQKTKTKVHTATVWTSLNSAGTTQIWKKFCQQPGHMVSWVNTRLAGIETVKYCFNIYRRENSLPSKFYVVFLNPFLLLSLTLKKKKKKRFFPRESLWVQEPLFFPIITHYKFGMCVGSAIPVSNFHRQTMTRQLSRAPAEGAPSQNMGERTQEAWPPAASSSSEQPSKRAAISWKVKVKCAT